MIPSPFARALNAVESCTGLHAGSGRQERSKNATVAERHKVLDGPLTCCRSHRRYRIKSPAQTPRARLRDGRASSLHVASRDQNKVEEWPYHPTLKTNLPSRDGRG